MTAAELATAALPAFLASLVEFVEALTIVLAVGTTRGWRPALIGTASATVVLIVAILAFGVALVHLPETTFKLFVGVLLVLFGMRWLRKACLRAAGVVALRDEQRLYADMTRELSDASRGARERARDWGAIATAFNGVAVEGLEVVFIVIAIGPTARSLRAASVGAAAAFLVVVALGVWLHRPLQRVPENALKLAVGVMLCGLGTFWAAEGLGLSWPGGDLAIPALIAGYLLACAIAVAVARGIRPEPHEVAA